jgi:hypothetical protein
MKPRAFLTAVFGLAVLMPSGCSRGVDAPPAATPPDSVAAPEQRVLTAELCKAALLELMRKRPEGLVNRFNPDEWSAAAVVQNEEGWYDFGSAFRIQPSKAIYVLTVMPSPDVRACIVEWQGSFIFENGQWVALPPTELLSAALQRGK